MSVGITMSRAPSFGTWEEAVVWLREQPERRQLVLDAFYDDPLVDAAERYSDSSEWRDVVRLLKGRSGRALDVGAGRGIASYALAKLGFEVVALEPDPSAIVGAEAIKQLARDAELQISVTEEFSERLPYADGSFDVVFARAVLHHSRDLKAACREIYRVLRPGGIFIAARDHVITRASDLHRFLDIHPLHALYGGEHAYLLSDYTSALQEAGFGALQTLAPLTSPINLFPHTSDTLREAIIDKLSSFVAIRNLWKFLLGSPMIFHLLLRASEHFDNRPGRLYSFVGTKSP
jgi:SAM-dependent methyltransferase